MKRIFLSLLLLIIVTACSSNKAVWVKSGSGPDEYKKDVYDCRIESELVSRYFNINRGLITLIERRRLFNQCMESRGYEIQEVK